jgi:hypothetical protein
MRIDTEAAKNIFSTKLEWFPQYMIEVLNRRALGM